MTTRQARKTRALLDSEGQSPGNGDSHDAAGEGRCSLYKSLLLRPSRKTKLVPVSLEGSQRFCEVSRSGGARVYNQHEAEEIFREA